MPGVVVTSPEIYAAGLLSSNKEPVIAHGITPSFFNITDITLISGINPFVNASSSIN